MKRLRVGFVGAGFNGNFHARAICQVRNMDIAGIVAPDGAEALSAYVCQNGLGSGAVYSNVIEMAKNVDAVAILCPNFARLEVMQQIAEAKSQGAELVGVLCEKPLARNCAEARQMVDLARGAGLLTSYLENQIYMPGVNAARTQLAAVEEAMGPVHTARSAEEHGGPHNGWFWDPTQQGGGVFCDMGCHSVGVGYFMCTPNGKPVNFLKPVSVSAHMALRKWGRSPWIEKLLADRGVDYRKTPAEDYACVAYTFRNPETGQLVSVRAEDSWCYDAPGLRLLMEALAPGWSYLIDTLKSTASLFISDVAASAVANMELALEKSQASRGALLLHDNEPWLYGYVAEDQQTAAAFLAGQEPLLNWEFGEMVTRLVMAAYMAAERGQEINLEDPAVLDDLDTYVPAIQQGLGADVLFGRPVAVAEVTAP